MPNQQFDEKPIAIFTDQFTDASTPSVFSRLYAGQSDVNFRFDTMQIFNSDTIDHTVIFSTDSGGSFPVGFGTVPAGAGFGIVPPFDFLAWNYPAANHYLIIPNTNIYWTVNEAVNTGKLMAFAGFGGFV